MKLMSQRFEQMFQPWNTNRMFHFRSGILNTIGLVFLFVCACILLFLFWNRNTGLEGFDPAFNENTTYRYTPNPAKPSVFKSFKINYLVYETSELLRFYKKIQKLVYVEPPPPDTAEAVIDQPYVDVSDEALGLAPVQPAPVAPPVAVQPPIEQFTGIVGGMDDADLASMDEYKSKLTTMELYSKYQKLKEAAPVKMNDEFGTYFLSANLAKDVSGLVVAFKKKAEFYNKEYSYIRYFTFPKATYAPSVFIDHFAELIAYHHKDDNQLAMLKDKFFRIVQPAFIFTQFATHYRTNIRMYDSQDDALFVINTALQYLKSADYSYLKPDKEGYLRLANAEIQPMALHIDLIRMTDISIIIFQLLQLMAGKVNPYFTYNFGKFKADYGKFVMDNKSDGLYLFMLERPPVFPRILQVNPNPNIK